MPLLAVIAAVGLLLRLHQIGSEGLWIDEAFSIWLARRPIGEMVRWVQDVDHHPPLYYALLHGWAAVFGAGQPSARLDIVSRALSALFGGLTIPVVYSLGRRLVDEKVGLIGALILALSPFHIRFAQEARMYTLLTLNASLAICAFVKLYGRARMLPLPWIGYVVFTAAMLWTHNTAILFPLAANLLVLGKHMIRNRSLASDPLDAAALPGCHRRGGIPWLRGWFAAQAAVLLLWLPWLPSFVSQAADVYGRFWLPAPTFASVVSIIGAFLCDFPPWPFLVSVVVDVVLASLALFGLRELHRRSAPAALLAALFVTPFAGQWFVSLWRPILCARTLIWTSIPLYLMVAAGVRWLEIRTPSATASRPAALVALAALLATNGAALCNYYATFEKESWDHAAALVVERVQPGDLLLFNDAWGQIPFDYYVGQLYNPQLTSSREKPRGTVAFVEHGLPVDLFDRGVLEPRMRVEDLSRLYALVSGRQRVWLVYSHQWYTDPEGLIPQALASTLDLQQQWRFEGLQVHLYVNR